MNQPVHSFPPPAWKVLFWLDRLAFAPYAVLRQSARQPPFRNERKVRADYGYGAG